MANVKSSKKLTIAASAALAAAVLVNNGQTAKADQVTANDKTQTSNSQAVQVTETPKQAADKADANFNQASQDLSKAQDAKTAADSAKKIADTNVQNAQNGVKTAQEGVTKAQNDVDEANNGGVQKAQDAVKTAQDGAVKAQNAENTAKQGVTDAQNAQTQAQKDYDAQASAVKDAQNKQASAQKNYDQAEDALKGTDADKAQQTADTADKNVTETTKDAQDAQTAKTTADTAVKTAQDDAVKAQNAEDSAKKSNDAAQSDAKTAKNTLDKANGVVATDTKTAQDAQKALDELGNNDKITLNEDYINFFKNLDKTYSDGLKNAMQQDADYDKAHPEESTYSTKNQDAFMRKMSNIIAGRDKTADQVKQIQNIVKDLYLKNTYKGTDADHDRIVNLDHMTDAQKHEINQYALNLINDVQRQMGRPEYKLSDGSIAVADAVAGQYTNDHWSGQNQSHDFKALNPGSDADKQYGISNLAENMSDDFAGYSAMKNASLSNNGGQYIAISDDQNRLHLPDNEVTMYDLKCDIYDGLRAMYFNNTEWAHATNFLAVANSNQDGTAGNYHMGVSVSRVGNGSNEYDIHYNIFTDFDINLSNGKYKDGNEISTDPSKAIKAAQDAVNKANADLNEAKGIQKTAQDAYDKANVEAEAAAKAYASAQANTKTANDAVAKAQANAQKAADALDKANQAVLDAKAAQKSAHEALDKFKATQTDKLQAVQDAKSALDKAVQATNDAQKVLADKQKALDNAKEAVKSAQDAYAKAQANTKSAQDAVTKAQKHVQDLQNAPKNLEAAQKVLADAQTKLKTAQAKQTEANDDVIKAQKAVEAAQSAYDDAKAAKDTADANLAKANVEEKAREEAEAAKNNASTHAGYATNNDYFNAVLDNAQNSINNTKEAKHQAENATKKVAKDIPAASAKTVKTYKMTIKKGRLYLGYKRVTAKAINKMLKGRVKFTVKGHVKSLKRVAIYNKKGIFTKWARAYKLNKILGFKKIGKYVYVQINKKSFVRFNDYFK